MDKKIIVVFGATGAQGGGLAHAILNDSNSEFSVRAVTRDVNSDKAKALASKGAEIVQADVDDKASVLKALEGVYGAYFVTFFWAHLDPERETKEAKIYAEAAREAGLKHVIWSTLEDVRKFIPLDNEEMPNLHEKYKVPHFDAKGEANKFFEGLPVTYLYASFYWENFIFFGSGPRKGEDGKYYLVFPLDDKKMAGIAAEDIGKCAYGIFKEGPSLAGQHIGVAGEHLSGEEMAEKLSSHLHKEIKYNNVTADTFRNFGFPGAQEVGNMFQFYRDYADECNRMRDVQRSRQLNPELKTFDQWLSENATRIPMG